MGLVALWHVESFCTRYRTGVPCIGRQILNLWATREVLIHALEGFLFPDTYHFDKDSTAKVVIDTMINRFEEIIAEIQNELSVEISEDKIDEIVTMASIVEREIIHDNERPKAASVFYNRISAGMPLQSCATVIYALGVHKNVLYYSDLEIDSKYNTYKYNSLPVGPIASPGKQSIKASINPDNTDYLYFILNTFNK